MTTQIKNTADIYFDFNSPVATTTVNTDVIILTGIPIRTFTRNEITIYPNPNTGEFTISFSNHFGEKVEMKIYNLVGGDYF